MTDWKVGYMKLLSLTAFDDKPLTVNAEKIVTIQKYQDKHFTNGAKITMEVGDVLYVKDSPASIVAALTKH